MKKFLLLITFLLCINTYAKGIYQWVNEDGVTEFSENPPAKGVKFTLVPIEGMSSGLNEFTSTETEEEADKNENMLSVVLYSDANGHYSSSGTINGIPVEFLLDTGATMVSVPTHIAQNIGLLQEELVRINTANGVISAFSTVLESISLGPITLHEIAATIYNDPHTDRVLLGMSFLKELEFIQRDNILTLRQPQKEE